MNTDKLVQEVTELIAQRISDSINDDTDNTKIAGIMGEACMHVALQLSSFALDNLSDRSTITTGMLVPDENKRFDLTITKTTPEAKSADKQVLTPTGPKKTDSIN